MANLSAQNLYDLTDDQVQSQVHSVFLTQLQNGPSVRGTFFGSVGAPAYGAVNGSWVDQVATALVCSSISRSSMFGFSKTINQQAADLFWETQLASTSANALQAGRSIYDWAFPSLCQANGSTFQDYLNNDPASWAQQLSALVVSGSFINTTIAKLLAQDPNWLQKLNLVFYKIGRLDNTRVQGVVDAWKSAFPNQAIAVVWQSYNFVPNNLFQPDQFLSMVNSAISVKVTSQGFPTRGITPIWATYGGAVVKFLHGTPSSMGLATGTSPDNTQNETFSSCFVEGTRVQLADGSDLPIEQVAEGHKVLAQGGVGSIHTAEDVVITSSNPFPIFGINDVKPFFSAGHLFWTKEGWKAVEPSVSLEENPGRAVGKLQPGDTVYRLKSVNPLAYDEIVIESLPSESVEPGTPIHGLHLEGEPSYHANGFLVAMNYPVITAKRLSDAFARLTASERKLIAKHLEPVMPLLVQSIGSFIEDPIRRSLNTDS